MSNFSSFCPVGFALSLLSAGCGSSDRPNMALDAAADSPSEIDAAPPRTFTQYVLDRQLLPATETQAQEYAFDLDGDTIVDNRLATVLAAYADMGFQNQFNIDAWIARGEAIMLAQLGAENYASEPSATFTLYQGADPMPPACAGPDLMDCRKHLMGTGSFSLKAGAPIDQPLAGMIASGTLTAGPGNLTVQFSLGFSPPITVTLVGARVELMPTATTLTGRVGGAITQSEIASKVMPALRESFALAVYWDCDPFGTPPECGCTAGTAGEAVIAQLDKSPSDCGISLAEVQNDAMTATLLAPDVTVANQPALSIGFGVTAVSGSFPAPM